MEIPFGSLAAIIARISVLNSHMVKMMAKITDIQAQIDFATAALGTQNTLLQNIAADEAKLLDQINALNATVA